MSLSKTGRESRKARLVTNHSGVWGSSSQDFVCLASMLFAHSAAYAAGAGGNSSPYALAGIPTLLSAVRCLLIEVNTPMYGIAGNAGRLNEIAGEQNEINIILAHYPIPPHLRDDLELLVQVRNEIAHPSHRPGGEQNNSPAYLKPLRDAGLLQSTGAETDYIWLSQLQSHRLFIWAFEVIESTVSIILNEHGLEQSIVQGLLASYTRYRQGELSGRGHR